MVIRINTRIHKPIKEANTGSFQVTQQVKDLASWLLWLGFEPWSQNSHMPQVWPKEKKEKRNTV